jgi:hypothetical protein
LQKLSPQSRIITFRTLQYSKKHFLVKFMDMNLSPRTVKFKGRMTTLAVTENNGQWIDSDCSCQETVHPVTWSAGFHRLINWDRIVGIATGYRLDDQEIGVFESW